MSQVDREEILANWRAQLQGMDEADTQLLSPRSSRPTRR